MRALGPGSVSSFLKVILDVVYAALVIGVAAAGLMTLLALLFSFNPDLMAKVSFRPDGVDLANRGPVLAGGLLAAALYMGGVLIIIGALRRIFVTLTAGDPFHPDNVARLRLIGVMLAALELGRYVVWGIGNWMPWVKRVDSNFSLTAWFSVLVVFVLAEVFREGARLRREAELTI
ncbi:DUF2975 domain-containing protein [Phenylobacterium hankyongense]|uniref:DUF2975 domain-containing protein n=1 Tax=Phenylobacterium hankyongense TaxID=1813876 RepID=A0A328AZ80_9CAUL|nr:DUF2975 domain-containing protein [Phenylobacterium hankyongense]RAK59491.1 DUF2975 domain-containing protein [Phenylobacterium hankyongense]